MFVQYLTTGFLSCNSVSSSLFLVVFNLGYFLIRNFFPLVELTVKELCMFSGATESSFLQNALFGMVDTVHVLLAGQSRSFESLLITLHLHLQMWPVWMLDLCFHLFSDFLIHLGHDCRNLSSLV